MLLSTLQYCILSEFRVDTLVKHTRSTNSFYRIKKFQENCYGRFASVYKRAFYGMQISQPVLIVGVCLTRNLHRSSVFSGLCSLTEREGV
jgi:hypothetical protein